MHESRYVVFGSTRGYGALPKHEIYWNGKIGHTVSRLTTKMICDAAIFATAREAYESVAVLVRGGHLPQVFLDSRVGKRMVTHD